MKTKSPQHIHSFEPPFCCLNVHAIGSRVAPRIDAVHCSTSRLIVSKCKCEACSMEEKCVRMEEKCWRPCRRSRTRFTSTNCNRNRAIRIRYSHYYSDNCKGRRHKNCIGSTCRRWLACNNPSLLHSRILSAKRWSVLRCRNLSNYTWLSCDFASTASNRVRSKGSLSPRFIAVGASATDSNICAVKNPISDSQYRSN